MEQQGRVNNRTFVLLNFRSIIVATTIHPYQIICDKSTQLNCISFRFFLISLCKADMVRLVRAFPQAESANKSAAHYHCKGGRRDRNQRLRDVQRSVLFSRRLPVSLSLSLWLVGGWVSLGSFRFPEVSSGFLLFLLMSSVWRSLDLCFALR